MSRVFYGMIDLRFVAMERWVLIVQGYGLRIEFLGIEPFMFRKSLIALLLQRYRFLTRHRNV